MDSSPATDTDLLHGLIVDDDRAICELLQEALESWGIRTQALNNPLEVEGVLEEQGRVIDLVLLDICMPEMSGLELISTIRQKSPQSKILIITGNADKKGAVRALRDGAFDLIEKPFKLEFLHHRIERAVQAQQYELERKKSLQELRRSREDLFRKTRQLRRANQELQDANTALSVLAHNIERSREESEQQICSQLRALIQPLKERLAMDRRLVPFTAEITALSEYAEELSAGLPEDLRISSSLSLCEYRIASMIKRGMTSQEIADHLSISPATVKTHRRNIRRKLRLAGTSSNLQTHLQAL